MKKYEFDSLSFPLDEMTMYTSLAQLDGKGANGYRFVYAVPHNGRLMVLMQRTIEEED